jgi:dTDP-glucose pyrophosphorylase
MTEQMNWQKNIVGESDSLRAAATVLNASPYKLVLVCSSEGKLTGTLTDGDLRRGLLRGLSLEDSVTKAMNRSFVAGHLGEPKSELHSLMRKRQIHELPILDKSDNVVDLVTDRPELSPFDGTFVIMAGGRGSRLMPLTDSTPKPMLLVGAKPILEHILTSAVSQGFENFVISVNYLGKQIENYFGDGSAWGVSITYLREEEPLGTAGALSLLPRGAPGPIVVSNGDLVTNLDYRAMIQNHEQSGATISMAIRRFELRNPYGVVATNGEFVEGIVEKPAYVSQVNTGIYVLAPEVLTSLQPNSFLNMTDLVQNALNQNEKVAAFAIHESWMDIGTPQDFQAANGN